MVLVKEHSLNVEKLAAICDNNIQIPGVIWHIQQGSMGVQSGQHYPQDVLAGIEAHRCGESQIKMENIMIKICHDISDPDPKKTVPMLCCLEITRRILDRNIPASLSIMYYDI
jgi:hypothetical protein